MNRITTKLLLLSTFAALFADLAAPPPAATGLWGNNRGCLRFAADRRTSLSLRATRIPPMTDRDAFTLRFRFRTLGPHAYGALAFIGVRAAGGDFKRNAAGVILHRHSKAYGLLGYPFIADGKGSLHTNKVSYVRLQYDTVYDATCTYTPARHTVSVVFQRPGGGSVSGVPLDIPRGTAWHANRLAVWNYADGQPRVARSAALTLLIDTLRLNGNAGMTFDRDLSELDEHSGDGGRWFQAPEPPLLAEFTGPRDVFPGEAARFQVQVREGEPGTVAFDLRRFDGTALLHHGVQPAAGRTAAVVFAAAELSAQERGEAALLISMTGHTERLVRGVVLHGRVFQNVLSEPADMQPGDEIVIDNMALCGPPDVIRPVSAKGTWWRRKYRLQGRDGTAEGGEHEMLCVEEHDPDAPESCLAPPFHLPLRLHGWYEIWVSMFRSERDGGIDVRLSGEPYFQYLDPDENMERPGGKKPVQRLVEIRFRAADLTGQGLVFQQPFGTFESEFKLCNASFAGVRLVKLADEQVARVRAEFADPDNQRIGFDNDGYSYFWKWGTHDPTCIARLFEPLRTPSVSFLNVSLGGLGGLTIPTPYSELYQLQGHTRDGDFRANEFFRWCAESQVNIVDTLAKRAHQLGKKLFVSTMMERCYSPDRFIRDHPDWRITRGRGVWDYAKPEVREFQIRKVAWICAHHDLDGFIVDFTRYGHYFNRDEPNKFEFMNAFVRDLRTAIDQVNAVKKRKVLLCASFGDRSWHLLHWGTGKLTDQGLDIQTWIREEWFDILMPEGPTCLDFVKMAAGTRTQVWPRKVKGVPLESSKGVHGKLGSPRITGSVKHAFDAGAAGIFFFNHEPRICFGRLGIRRELPLRALADIAYGIRAKSAIVFADWRPGFEARQRQRRTFVPAAVGTHEGKVDARIRLPIRNTFNRTVEVRVHWGGSALVGSSGTSEDKSPGGTAAHRSGTARPARRKAGGPVVPRPLQVLPYSVTNHDGAGLVLTPETKSIHLEPGTATEVGARIRGNCPDSLRTDGLFAAIAFYAGPSVVFRHRVPVRLTSSIACELRNDNPPAFVPFGDAEQGPVWIAVGRDALILHWLPDQTSSSSAGAPCPHDDFRRLERGTYLDIRVDVDGREERFVEFAVDSGGGRCEAEWAFSPFHGRHLRKVDWNGAWSAEAIPAKAAERAYVRIALPFGTLGNRPAPDAHWRLAVTVCTGKGPVFSWPPSPAGSPARFGSLTFRQPEKR